MIETGYRKIGLGTILIALALSGCSSEPRIDGSSDSAFDQSHARLVEALSPEDRVRLTLAQLIVLAPLGCLTSAPIPGQPFLTKSMGGQAILSSCREEMHGMTFQDIMDRAYPDQGVSGGSAAVPPNNSFKPNLLRKSA